MDDDNIYYSEVDVRTAERIGDAPLPTRATLRMRQNLPWSSSGASSVSTSRCYGSSTDTADEGQRCQCDKHSTSNVAALDHGAT